jgi:phosphate transport system permease protein
LCPRPAQKIESSRRARRHDALARWIIVLGGLTVIASVIAIVAMIVGVTLPLFRAPRMDVVCTGRLPKTLSTGEVVGCGVNLPMDGRAATGLFWIRSGSLVAVDLQNGTELSRQPVKPPAGSGQRTLREAQPLAGERYSLLWSDGGMSLVELAAANKADGDKASPAPAIHTLASLAATKEPSPRLAVLRRTDSGTLTRVALLPDGRLSVLRQAVTENLMGESETTTHENMLREDFGNQITALAISHDGDSLYAGTNDGLLARWRLGEDGKPVDREVVRAFPDHRAITALALVLGDVSLAVGDARGQLSTWFPVRADSSRKLRLVHHLTPHQSPITAIWPSGRNKSLLSVDNAGTIHLDYMTSERHLGSIAPESSEKQSGATAGLPSSGGTVGQANRGARPSKIDGTRVALGLRGDVVLELDPTGATRVWRIDAGCPEISFKTLFGRVHYEGYDAPDYVWQTTGGEDFEPKFSLVPLIFGTLKGTFYAMLFAVPLALFGAAYTSYFTTPGLRRAIKPIVEIMASVPSVVIGFLIALWLAPILERWVLALLLCMATVPTTFILFMVLWQFVRGTDWAKRVEGGYEFLVMLPVLAAGVAAAVCLVGPVEAAMFGGNFRHWLFESPLGMRYDQRNCVIIAFGLGFTVIPIIFSIAEDSLSNVPYNMTAASMALGASRWQTLWRVVLPSASPGIFAAMMIGFGRAVGETMIVLMATGNTPILSGSPFNGMRTLSANIAVEIPEAPVGGTLYRVLFLCAVLLFLLTFTLNTVAELVRQYLRKRYGRFS